MILNVGLRTDIVFAYSEWLFNRIREGFVYARNPLFPAKVVRYDLSPEKVDAIVFCSKNYSPILPRIGEILNTYRTLFHYTVTAYGNDLEPLAPSKEESVDTLIRLSRTVGRDRLFWRFDPLLFTDNYPEERVLRSFDELAGKIAPYVKGCIFSFAEIFIKLPSILPDLVLIGKEDKRRIAGKMSEIARRHSLPLRHCGANEDFTELGIKPHGCVTLDDIAAANGCVFKSVPHKGNRRGCLCIPSRDIGWYDSCPIGCKYCNATRDPSSLPDNLSRHDPNSPILIGSLRPDDTILRAQQTSLLKNDGRQISLFDL